MGDFSSHKTKNKKTNRHKMAKQTWRSWLEKSGMTALKLNANLLEADLSFQQPDRDAAWDLYIELVTRITTQPLSETEGKEKAALDSVYALFPLTRETIKRHGRHCHQFARLAIVILNQKIRPFTSKWHRLSEDGGFADKSTCQKFRAELVELQKTIKTYTAMLADLAEVEDLTSLSSIEI